MLPNFHLRCSWAKRTRLLYLSFLYEEMVTAVSGSRILTQTGCSNANRKSSHSNA